MDKYEKTLKRKYWKQTSNNQNAPREGTFEEMFFENKILQNILKKWKAWNVPRRSGQIQEKN